jgi:hypothetical protein
MTIEEEAWEAFEAVRDPFDAQEPTPLAELATAIIRITKWLHRGGLEVLASTLSRLAIEIRGLDSETWHSPTAAARRAK